MECNGIHFRLVIIYFLPPVCCELSILDINKYGSHETQYSSQYQLLSIFIQVTVNYRVMCDILLNRMRVAIRQLVVLTLTRRLALLRNNVSEFNSIYHSITTSINIGKIGFNFIIRHIGRRKKYVVKLVIRRIDLNDFSPYNNDENIS